MPRKGQKNCCCDNCFFHPLGAGDDVSPVQQYCCSCLPLQICASISSHELDVTGSSIFSAACRSPLPDVYYMGSVSVPGGEIDLQIALRVVDEICYLCLSSSALGISADDYSYWQVIDAAARDKPNYFCQKLYLNGAPAGWDVPAEPYGTLRVQLQPVENTPITGRQPCVDPYGRLQEDTDPIRNVCTGCGCICTNACVIVVQVGAAEELPMYRDGVNWTTGGEKPFTVTLEADYETGNCQLALTATGSIKVASGSNPIPISADDPEHPCPRPQVKFMGIDTDGMGFTVEFICQDCDGCSQVESPCCDRKLPRILTASITSPDGTCGCGEMSAALVYDWMFEGWIFEGKLGGCKQPLKLVFDCGGDRAGLAFSSPPCVILTSSEDDYAASCEPLRHVYHYHMSGIHCCGTIVGFENITITVTE